MQPLPPLVQHEPQPLQLQIYLHHRLCSVSLPDALLDHRLLTTSTMTSRGVSTLKFVGTVSLGLLTVSDDLGDLATSRETTPALGAGCG